VDLSEAMEAVTGEVGLDECGPTSGPIRSSLQIRKFTFC
jgi:hypothetical protein